MEAFGLSPEMLCCGGRKDQHDWIDDIFSEREAEEEGEGPAPEEIMTLIKPPYTHWIALKSGYGKYVSIDAAGVLSATSEAIGAKERWEIVFQVVRNQSALQAYNGGFLSCDLNEDCFVYAKANKAREKEIIKIRTNVEKVKPTDFTRAVGKENVGECEISYIKMYQHQSRRSCCR